MIPLLLFLQQAASPPPTVGDTLWAVRLLRVAPGDQVRPADWSPEGEVQLLGRPQLVTRGDRVELRYPLVAWAPGSHRVEIPGPIITHASGAEDTASAEAVTFEVASVLPSGQPDSTLEIQPPANLVLRRVVSPYPAFILCAVALVLLVPFHWWWNRRGRPLPPPAGPAPPAPLDDLLRRWAEIGERRAVAGAAATRLRAAIARALPSAHPGLDTPEVVRVMSEHRPTWPVRDLADLLAALENVRFAPGADAGTDVLALYHRSAELGRTLETGAP